MNRREAALKHAKLLRLARGTTNPNEAAAARLQADKIAAEHHLGQADIEHGRSGAAFDDLVDELQRFVAERGDELGGLFGAGPIVRDVLSKIKSMGDDDKASYLRQFAGVVRTASLVAGNTPSIKKLKQILDTTLKNHELIL
jgi:hypothetical protein